MKTTTTANQKLLSFAACLIVTLFLFTGHPSFAGPLDNWSSPGTGTLNLLKGVTYGNGEYVAVGYSGEILTSTNGSSWVDRSIGTGTNLTSITFANGVFVAAGDRGFETSVDATSWSTETGGVNPEINAGYNNITYENGAFEAVGIDELVATSTDGYSWGWGDLNGADLFGSAYGNGTYVVVGYVLAGTGFIWNGSSISDGVLANNNTMLNPPDNIYGVAYGNGIFVVTGGNGKVLTSMSGSSWASQTSNTTNDLMSVAFGDGLFVAVGSGGTIISSPDGINWTSRNSGSTNTLNGVSFLNNSFVSVGASGTILKSGVVQNSIINDAVSLGGGWFYSGIFGDYAGTPPGWIYHLDLGWLYFAPSDTSASTWMWDSVSGMGWLWTNMSTFPNIYRASDNAWLWYDQGTTNPCWFYNLTAGKWESH